MGAIWFRARSEMRRSLRALVALGLLVGVIGGAAAAAAAGARRTESAYPRFLERYGVYHAAVAASEEDVDELARIPQVEAVAPTRLFLGGVTVSGKTLSFPDVFLIADMTPPGAPNPMKLLAGRPPDPAAVEDVVVNYALAERLGIGPGDRVSGVIFAFGPEGPREQAFAARVSGIVVQPGGFETLTGRGFPAVIAFSRAFGERHAALADRSGGAVTGVRLRRGDADIPALTAELRARGIETDGPPTPISDFTEDVQELNRVPAVALWSLVVLLSLAGAAIFAQSIAREATIGAADFPTLRALGMSRAGLFALGMARAIAVAFVAAPASMAVAFALSPLTPVGIARVAEPDPGFALETALAIGAALTLIAVVGAGIVPAWRAATAGAPAAGGWSAGRRSRIAEGLARASAPAPAVAGVRMALEPGRGASAVPVRTAALGSAIGIGAVVVALVFVSSLDHLLAEPRLTGYTWDAAVLPNGPEEMEAAEAALPRDIVERTWKGAIFPLVDVQGLTITAFVSDGPAPSLIEGRAPRTQDEIVLDPITLERLGKGIGDTVTVGDAPETGGGPPETGSGPPESTSPRDLVIVGSFVVARLPFQPNENASQGAGLTPEGLRRIQPFEFEAIHVSFRPGVDFLDGVERVKQATAGRAFAVFTPQQLGAVRNIRRIAVLPVAVGALLAAVAAAALAHTLVSSARRRRRDLAVLRTIGFVARQVRATVAWQATALVLVPLLVAIPLGVATGRWAWRLFAGEIIVVPEPVVSLLVIAVIGPATILLANLIAWLPARAAARTQPALVLRAE